MSQYIYTQGNPSSSFTKKIILPQRIPSSTHNNINTCKVTCGRGGSPQTASTYCEYIKEHTIHEGYLTILTIFSWSSLRKRSASEGIKPISVQRPVFSSQCFTSWAMKHTNQFGHPAVWKKLTMHNASVISTPFRQALSDKLFTATLPWKQCVPLHALHNTLSDHVWKENNFI